MNAILPLILNELDQAVMDSALKEDLGWPYRDVTTDFLFPEQVKLSQAYIISKDPESIVISGLPIVKAILEKLDANSMMETAYQDGEILSSGTELLTLKGSASRLLMAERTVLNFLQRLCGIATQTAKYVSKIRHTKTQILDTRKTTPGMRHLEKYAVQCGGGVNHRLGLYDAIMIKDTHSDAFGGLEPALAKLPKDILQKLPVIVEVRDLNELSIALDKGLHKVTRVLLDNMSPETMKEAVKMCQGIMPTEASGNINLENVASVAECGVDFISIGKLTHSVHSVDLSMKFRL